MVLLSTKRSYGRYNVAGCKPVPLVRRRVVDKLKLNYPTLKAQGLPEKYNVQGFPTLVIIDQKGVIRGWHNGYSANLRDEVSKTINRLLSGHD